MKKETKNKIGFTLGVAGTIVGGITMGWWLHIFTESRIPYSYRTDSIILDTLAALGIRNYNP